VCAPVRHSAFQVSARDYSIGSRIGATGARSGSPGRRRDCGQNRYPRRMSTAHHLLPESVGVIGAGTMGAGIGLAFAVAGCPDVRLMARHDASLARAEARVDDGPEPSRVRWSTRSHASGGTRERR